MSENEAFHPKNVMLNLILIGLSMLFAAISIAYVYTRVQYDLPPIKLPWLFFLNSLILIGSSVTLIRAKTSYENDATETYKKYLFGTLILSLLFMVLQFIAWGQLYANEKFIHSDVGTSYVYALSILHLLHVLGGIPFLIIFSFNAYTKMKEPVSVLVYFSDPDKRRGLKLLTKYWHFLDILWLFLILFLGINALI
jgi:cytochrome c oxidase subunit 3